MPKSMGLGGQPSAREVEYCCSGCRTVASVEEADSERGAAAQGLFRLGLSIFFTMNVMVFTMALWSRDIYPEESFTSPLAVTLRSVFRWASLVFSAPVLWLLGGPIMQGVWQALRRWAITTDLLILLGVGAAYSYSVISVLRGEGHVYFEVGSMVLVFVSIGRWMEAKGKRRTGESLDALANLLPARVRRQNAAGTFQETSRDQVVTGDVLRVLAGERFPVDGRITLGEAHVDEQMVTGESQPTEKRSGDQVFSGTLNVDGDLHLEVTAADGCETVSRLIELVRTARSLKGRQERLADRIAVWFIPIVCLIAVAAAWIQGQAHGLDQGILTGLAVVLIACPCALGLATPMAVWTALGRAAECGVLFRSGLVMERLAAVKFACFDKTGTLTSGKPSVAALLVADQQPPELLLEVAATVAAGSTHPLSQAIQQFVNERLSNWTPSETPTVVTVPGKGLRTELPQQKSVSIGNRRLMEESQLDWPASLTNELSAHETAQQVFVGWNGQVRGVFCFGEVVRPEVTEAIAACRALDLELQLLTGDGAPRAEAIGEQFSVATKSNQLPDDKVAAVRELARQGSVAMIGDGLNDAPALAAADVGVALGCGADVSRDAAGVCLLGDDLRRFPWAVGLARATSRIVKQNLFWAFTYNGIGIAMAATGRLNPIWAALAMAVSSLLVVTNSLRLGRYPDQLSSSEEIPMSLYEEFAGTTRTQEPLSSPPKPQTFAATPS
ncbi:MAG: cation-translocating P-type ATPase [Planctomycetes bacterium]|nr:cation-translocating P-type ATPase [Planctomycetota bacterium]